MEYTSIVFDFFGVICSEVAPMWLARHFDEQSAMTLKATLVRAADLGELSQVDLFCELGARTGLSAKDVERQWLECAKIDQRMVAVVHSVRRKRRTGLLSNAPSGFLRELLQREGLGDGFDAVVVSSEHRCVKPERRAYALVLDQLGSEARHTLFIDDNPINVRGAQQAGMGGLLFKSYETFRWTAPAYDLL